MGEQAGSRGPFLAFASQDFSGNQSPGPGRRGAGFPARAGGVSVAAGRALGLGDCEVRPRTWAHPGVGPSPWDPGLAVTLLGPRPACPQDGSRSGRGGHRTRVPPAGAGGGGREGPGGVPGAGALPGRETCGCLNGGSAVGEGRVLGTQVWRGEVGWGGTGVREEDVAGGVAGRGTRGEEDESLRVLFRPVSPSPLPKPPTSRKLSASKERPANPEAAFPWRH